MMVASQRVAASPSSSASEKVGNNPCTRVSAVPTVMIRKPQKIRTW
jgi:hypothetical protein